MAPKTAMVTSTFRTKLKTRVAIAARIKMVNALLIEIFLVLVWKEKIKRVPLH
jgi:hypothetical protein